MKNRIFFFLIAAFIINALNFIKDLEDESVAEALTELVFTVPWTFTFILLIYYSRNNSVLNNKKKNG
ncbi:hypothetical protein CHU92_01165 [Flavobacterium cyanobacteriorum]|uniref:Uncharacterized protein n=1 Tax=Flavobacterium cyanobacteriorum TaxID=2022802 RepID=A0A256A262_9FLAO|nr:hypothetical protein [Flavobacterium cyanobacteriorum]OYQ47174.1 hypothetical protein CHU92_01165 [Flavobacterium cyanobacteriorum]